MLTTEEKKVVTKNIARYCEIRDNFTDPNGPNEEDIKELFSVVNALNNIGNNRDDKMEVITMILRADKFLHEEGLL